MSRHGNRQRDERSGWSFLGFLRSVLGDGPSFWRLFALILLLGFCYALAKGDVAALYGHLTEHTPALAKFGIPPGGVGVYFGARRCFHHHQEARARRALEQREAARRLKKARKEEARKELPGNGRSPKTGPEKAPD
jgi:hypothetical protein